jgi:hypothetical protein
VPFRLSEFKEIKRDLGSFTDDPGQYFHASLHYRFWSGLLLPHPEAFITLPDAALAHFRFHSHL